MIPTEVLESSMRKIFLSLNPVMPLIMYEMDETIEYFSGVKNLEV